ncbi:MAG: M23 family metallopeptidase [Defluviitaleaceae bacterium]|nr:M23 family metallopeptidase [Defluviitaleaceae bacterium]
MRASSFERGLRRGASVLRSIRRSRTRVRPKGGRLRLHRPAIGRARFVGLRGLGPYSVHIFAACLVVIVVVMAGAILVPVRRVNIHPDVVAAFQIPQRSIITLRVLSDIHALDFPEVLAVYALENNFFPTRAEAPPPETIEYMFIQHYEMIRASFRRSDVLRYEDIFRNILTEMRFFPIPIGFDNEFEPSYMYGDSFGTRNVTLANPRAGGTNIYDRENVPGRIPVVAVASGTILRSGWTNNFGYRVEVQGERGTVFTYSHLHAITEGINDGETIMAGEVLGSIGNTGFAGLQHARGQAPAHLRFTIAPQTRLTMDVFYINPYPFLRLVEEFRVDMRQHWFNPAMPHMPLPLQPVAPQMVWPQPMPQTLPRF